MRKFTAVKEKYLLKNVREDNIDYAIESIKEGVKKEHIIENLTADYRGMSHEEVNALLWDLFKANGGEFRKENRGGYLYGTFFLLLALLGLIYFYTVSTVSEPGSRRIPIGMIILIIGAFCRGIYLLVKSMLGKYRESDEPFKD